MFGRRAELPVPLDPMQWSSNRTYLYGIDLFNAGYYWEAHETWEGLWIQAGRSGLVADFLKGLIKLAAAGVKIRQGILQGVKAHLGGAGELFEKLLAERGNPAASFAGLTVADLLELAAFSEQQFPPSSVADTNVKIVFPLPLRPFTRET